MKMSSRKAAFSVAMPWLAVTCSWPPRWDSQKGPCWGNVDTVWPCMHALPCGMPSQSSPLSWLLPCRPDERAASRVESNRTLGSCCVEPSGCAWRNSRLLLGQIPPGSWYASSPSCSRGVLCVTAVGEVKVQSSSRESLDASAEFLAKSRGQKEPLRLWVWLQDCKEMREMRTSLLQMGIVIMMLCVWFWPGGLLQQMIWLQRLSPFLLQGFNLFHHLMSVMIKQSVFILGLCYKPFFEIHVSPYSLRTVTHQPIDSSSRKYHCLATLVKWTMVTAVTGLQK